VNYLKEAVVTADVVVAAVVAVVDNDSTSLLIGLPFRFLLGDLHWLCYCDPS